MRKLFTLAAAVLFAGSMMAGTYKTYALSDLTKNGSTYEKTGLSGNDQKLNKGERVVEVPSADAEGTLYLSGTAENTNRYASIYKTNGTVYDADRRISMASGYNPTGIAFTASDLLSKDGKYYIVFGSSDDYKINAFKYTLIDPTKATVKNISVNGEAIKDFDAATLSYDVELAFGTTDIPVVTAVAGDGASIVITQATEVEGTATVVCTSKDGTSEEKTYTINFSIATSQSTDATLKSLKVDGKDMPGFKADSLEYEWTVAYTSTAIPTVTYEVNDATASAGITPATEITKAKTDAGTTVIVVTAQDGTTKKTYKVAFIRADAVKKINEVIMSNSYSAYVPEGQAANDLKIYAFYLEGEAEPTVSSNKVNDGTTWAQEGNVVTLTGADASTATYTLVVEAVAPLAFTANAITFDGTETWVKGAYGFNGGWKFSKTDSDFSREIAGKTHVEIFLPACDSLELTGAVADRDIRVYINGTEFGNKPNLKNGKKLGLKVAQDAAFMLTIKSAQSSGDGGIKGIQLFKSEPTAIDDIEAGEKAVKVIRDGQLLIIKGSCTYNVLGTIIR